MNNFLVCRFVGRFSSPRAWFVCALLVLKLLVCRVVGRFSSPRVNGW